ncbi:hypothetical protein N0V90_012531 [Kalmusia sp. IMI 367209]|nr:hypothetical protein N0V90_012531 [Kalmusia sp. IMI 367209]
MARAIQLNDIKTLTRLYKDNSIPPNTDDRTTRQPNASFNDKISIIRQDITSLAVDAIVNAANESLLGGGGVDGAIHAAAGDRLLDECRTLDGCDTGDAKMTAGYDLPAKHIIHAVGPRFFRYSEADAGALLRGCYRRGLELAVENGLKSIAFPAISTGIFSYPNVKACNCVMAEVRSFLDEGKGHGLERIIFCNFLQKDEDAYYKTVPKYFPAVAEAEKADKSATTLTDETELAVKLPNPPTTEPKEPEEPSPKKQKTDGAEDDFVIVDKEDAKELPKADF